MKNMGIVIEGVSESCHGGIKWYNLVKNIKKDDEV